jgi:hypothetical protein
VNEKIRTSLPDEQWNAQCRSECVALDGMIAMSLDARSSTGCLWRDWIPGARQVVDSVTRFSVLLSYMNSIVINIQPELCYAPPAAVRPGFTVQSHFFPLP